MEMRKFLVEIKPDGRVYATEYTDAPAYPKIVRDRLGELARESMSATAFADLARSLKEPMHKG